MTSPCANGKQRFHGPDHEVKIRLPVIVQPCRHTNEDCIHIGGTGKIRRCAKHLDSFGDIGIRDVPDVCFTCRTQGNLGGVDVKTKHPITRIYKTKGQGNADIPEPYNPYNRAPVRHCQSVPVSRVTLVET
jgi:hypothetical protein